MRINSFSTFQLLKTESFYRKTETHKAKSPKKTKFVKNRRGSEEKKWNPERLRWRENKKIGKCKGWNWKRGKRGFVSLVFLGTFSLWILFGFSVWSDCNARELNTEEIVEKRRRINTIYTKKPTCFFYNHFFLIKKKRS